MPDERRQTAWIGASLVIEGNLTSSEDTSLAGQLTGDVAVREHALVVSPEGRVRGNIVARAVVVHGKVEGNITATQRVEVSGTGTVEGDITAPVMALSDGAVLRGRVKLGAATR